MKNLTKKLFEKGFNKLQEKEDCIFYEKILEYSPTEIHQICLIYDKKDKKVKSLDTYVINDSEMRMVKPPSTKEIKDTMERLLS